MRCFSILEASVFVVLRKTIVTWVAKDLFFDGVTGQDATKYGSLRDNYMNLIRDRIVGKFLRANRLLKDNPSLNGIKKSNFI